MLCQRAYCISKFSNSTGFLFPVENISGGRMDDAFWFVAGMLPPADDNTLCFVLLGTQAGETYIGHADPRF